MSVSRRVAVATCWILCLCVGCHESTSSPLTGTERESASPRHSGVTPEQVAHYLGALPTWPQLQPGTPEAEAAMNVLAQIAEQPLPLIHLAVHLRFMMDRNPDSDDPLHTRLFLLNRYLFNVPGEPMAPMPMPFPAWARAATDPPGPLWPLGIGPDGRPILIGRFYPIDRQFYDPVFEFIVFQHAYGLRASAP